MQLVKTARDNLLRPVEMVSGIVERKHTLPVLTNLLIRKENNTVFFLSTDTEIQVTTSASIGADEENAAITVGARKLVDILRALPDTSDVSITLTDNRLIIQSGTFSGKLQTLPADDFPTVPIAPQYKATLTIQQKMLKELFGAVHFAMALQDIR
jgi:DNA polymerase-3 subunit beta